MKKFSVEYPNESEDLLAEGHVEVGAFTVVHVVDEVDSGALGVRAEMVES